MKNILLSFLFLGTITNLFGQNDYQKFVNKFYSKIDSTKQLKCCDSNHHGFSLVYEIPLMELPYDKVDLKDFEERNSDDDYVNSYVDDLVEAYYKVKPSIRKQITKSCYHLDVDYKINKNIAQDGFYWIEGNLKIKISFQGEDPDFCLPWWRKIRCKLKL
jgi:hypothetical protein